MLQQATAARAWRASHRCTKSVGACVSTTTSASDSIFPSTRSRPTTASGWSTLSSRTSAANTGNSTSGTNSRLSATIGSNGVPVWRFQHRKARLVALGAAWVSRQVATIGSSASCARRSAEGERK
ncbi:unnamed protein product [Trichogramma brassicae]|uniref:Uncharacterized protein n=1 Tax=Trichogramma brassicae TaxID=86971 RepID=A0A6H5I4Y2_9HYME|nr:unnamed protein product [Trichogramma brassicae]